MTNTSKHMDTNEPFRMISTEGIEVTFPDGVKQVWKVEGDIAAYRKYINGYVNESLVSELEQVKKVGEWQNTFPHRHLSNRIATLKGEADDSHGNK